MSAEKISRPTPSRRDVKLGAVILAGGESSRMGRDKAWVEIEGQSLIAHALATIRAAGVQEIFISGRAGVDYGNLGCPVLLDLASGSGPLGGIQRALEATRAPLMLVLAVDLPRMTPAFIRKLAAACQRETGVVPELRGQLEPLAAIYPRRCLSVAHDCLLRGRLAVRDFAMACVREGALRKLKVRRADFGCFENWNCPADVGGRSSEEIRNPKCLRH